MASALLPDPKSSSTLMGSNVASNATPATPNRYRLQFENGAETAIVSPNQFG
jgi:hypothetical protein